MDGRAPPFAAIKLDLGGLWMLNRPVSLANRHRLLTST